MPVMVVNCEMKRSMLILFRLPIGRIIKSLFILFPIVFRSRTAGQMKDECQILTLRSGLLPLQKYYRGGEFSTMNGKIRKLCGLFGWFLADMILQFITKVMLPRLR